MPLNSDVSLWDDTAFNNLCAHYKDTYDLHLSIIKQRDTLFYILLVILAFFSLQITSADLVNGAVSSYIDKQYSVTVDKNSSLFSSLVWLLLFGVSSKYYQTVIQIERQYDYIHHLEKLLNLKYPETQVFTREGRFYLDRYPLFSSWIYFLYTLAFPTLILFSIIFRIKGELAKVVVSNPDFSTGFTSYLVSIMSLGFFCYLLVGTSTLLYLWKLHGEFLLKKLHKLRNLSNWI